MFFVVLSLKNHYIVLPRIGWVPNYLAMSTAWRQARNAQAMDMEESQEAAGEAAGSAAGSAGESLHGGSTVAGAESPGLGGLARAEDGAGDPDIAAEAASRSSRASRNIEGQSPRGHSGRGDIIETRGEIIGASLVTSPSPNHDVMSIPSPTLASPPAVSGLRGSYGAARGRSRGRDGPY